MTKDITILLQELADAKHHDLTVALEAIQVIKELRAHVRELEENLSIYLLYHGRRNNGG